MPERQKVNKIERQIHDMWPEVDSRFKIRIWSPKTGGVTGLLPPSFSEQVSTQWSAPFNQIFAAVATGAQVYEQAKAFTQGTIYNPEWSAATKKQTYMIWGGSSPLILSGIKMLFISKDETHEDVLVPVRRLQAFSTPRLDNVTTELLEPPPALVIELGYVLRLVDAVIQVSRIEWHAPLDQKGLPTRADVSLSITSRSAYVLERNTDYVDSVAGWDKHPHDILKEKAKREHITLKKLKGWGK